MRRRSSERIARIPGIADPRIQQAFNAPTFNVDVDRTRAQIVGVSERDVAQNLQDTLAGSIQTAPTFWLNPRNGVSYPIVAQTPQYWVSSLSNLENIPASQGSDKQILGGVATIKRGVSHAVVSHYAVQPVIDIFATNNERDLGAVAADIQKILDETANEAPTGSTVVVRGQVQTMTYAYQQLFVGIALAIVLIYLLIVVNFQSWLDPFVIVSALPTALAGIVWMLFVTRTTLSVPALTGAIMCMGVATANSILVVSFARDRLAEGADAATAAIDAGFTRFRPVLMTALAMIIGMAPMALSARVERAARARRDRRPRLLDNSDAAIRSGGLPACSRASAKPCRRARAALSRRGRTHMSQDQAEAPMQEYSPHAPDLGRRASRLRGSRPALRRKSASLSRRDVRCCSWRWRQSRSPTAELPGVIGTTKNSTSGHRSGRFRRSLSSRCDGAGRPANSFCPAMSTPSIPPPYTAR